METRKQKRRSLRLTLLLLLLTAIILLSSSYAWFTANQTVTVSQLQVNVAAQNGLQISADGSVFSALIGKDDLITASGKYTDLLNQLPVNLAPVSTGKNVTDGKMDMYLGTVNANATSGKYELTATKETEINSLLEDMQEEADTMGFQEFAFMAEELQGNIENAYKFELHKEQFKNTFEQISEGEDLLQILQILDRQKEEMIQKRERQIREMDSIQRKISECLQIRKASSRIFSSFFRSGRCRN